MRAFAWKDGDILFLDASRFQSAGQIQVGDADAAADDGSFAGTGNSVGIYQAQYNEGFRVQAVGPRSRMKNWKGGVPSRGAAFVS